MPRTISPAHEIDQAGLRAMLEEQRRFRLDQLAQLHAQSGDARTETAGRYLDPLDASADRARTEVSEVLAAAAVQALEDIDAALARMDAGRRDRQSAGPGSQSAGPGSQSAKTPWRASTS